MKAANGEFVYEISEDIKKSERLTFFSCQCYHVLLINMTGTTTLVKVKKINSNARTTVYALLNNNLVKSMLSKVDNTFA